MAGKIRYVLTIVAMAVIALLPSLSFADPPRAKVVIDPGHGGQSMGAPGFHSVYEKYVTLQVAQRLGRLLSERKDIALTYTRTDDTFIDLKDRAEMANRIDADIFVSIHCNASTSPEAHGIETYYAGLGGEDRQADLVAERENAGAALLDVEEDQALKGILADLGRNGTLNESAVLAEEIQNRMTRAFPETVSRDVRQARFAVLRRARMPAVVVEVGFITHEVEGMNLLLAPYQERLAAVMRDSIVAFLGRSLARAF